MNLSQDGKTILGDMMKKAIRIFDAVLLALCTVLFGIIIWGTVVLPDSVVSSIMTAGSTSIVATLTREFS